MSRIRRRAALNIEPNNRWFLCTVSQERFLWSHWVGEKENIPDSTVASISAPAEPMMRRYNLSSSDPGSRELSALTRGAGIRAPGGGRRGPSESLPAQRGDGRATLSRDSKGRARAWAGAGSGRPMDEGPATERARRPAPAGLAAEKGGGRAWGSGCPYAPVRRPHLSGPHSRHGPRGQGGPGRVGGAGPIRAIEAEIIIGRAGPRQGSPPERRVRIMRKRLRMSRYSSMAAARGGGARRRRRQQSRQSARSAPGPWPRGGAAARTGRGRERPLFSSPLSPCDADAQRCGGGE